MHNFIFNNPILLQKPAKLAEPYNWVMHIPFAFFLIQQLRPKILVELGVHTGNSFNAFCQAVALENTETKCYGVDLWQGDEHAGFYSDTIYSDLSYYQNLKYQRIGSLIRKNFNEAVIDFEDGSIDLLHIDGLHTFEAVQNDFDLWLPKMSSNGVIIFHDTMVLQRGFGVYKFWNKVTSSYPHFEFRFGHGLGVLAVGKNLKSSFLEFIQHANSNDTIHKAFEYCGSIIFNERKIDSLSKILLSRQNEILILNERLNKYKKKHFYITHPWLYLFSKIKELYRKGSSKKYWRNKFNKDVVISVERYTYISPGQFTFKKTYNHFYSKPLISIILSVSNTDTDCIHATIDSIKNQFYPNWELCIIADPSAKSDTLTFLKTISEKRIKIKFSQINLSPSVALNQAIEMSSGEFIASISDHDVLTIDAFLEVVKAINDQKADLIYSDEDHINLQGKHVEPHFKGNFAPDQLLATNYISSFITIKRQLVETVGGYDTSLEVAPEYDLLLKLSEKSERIYHIPKVLSHKKKKIADEEALSAISQKEKTALQNAIRRRGMNAEILSGNVPGIYRVKRKILSDVLVSIIIPFKDKPQVLKTCIDSILQKSTYSNFEIIAVSNNSNDPETFDMMDHYKIVDERIAFFEFNYPFNYSRINNDAVQIAKGTQLILLNNDVEVITPDWIESLLEFSQRKEIGAVGAKLYYPNDTVQHAGLAIGINGVAAHLYRGYDRKDPGRYGDLVSVKNVMAVTGACIMVKKETYEEVKGLNADELKIAFNDVDFCLRLIEKGYLNIFTPHCELYHHESLSRGFDDTKEKKEYTAKEAKFIYLRYKDLFAQGDPYYNPNLTKHREDLSLNNKLY